MALQKTFNDTTGATYTNAYVRITKVIMDRNLVTPCVDIYYDVWVSSTEKSNGSPVLGTLGKHHVVKNEGGATLFDDYFSTAVLDAVNANVVSQAYEYLKAEDAALSGATNV